MDVAGSNTVSVEDDVISYIFSNCDATRSNAVSVEVVMKFISPFVAQNDELLRDLKRILDPKETDCLLDYETFSARMKEWISLITNCGNDEHHSCSKKLFSHNIIHSTPKGTLENMLNVQNLSLHSLPDDTALDLDEQICDLRHQNRKLDDDLNNAKVQLLASEEQVLILQEQNAQLNKLLQTNQQTLAGLQKEKYMSEELNDTNSRLTKQNQAMQESHKKAMKKTEDLKKSLKTMEQENQDLRNKLEAQKSRCVENEKLIGQLNSEISMRDLENEALDKRNQNMADELAVLKDELNQMNTLTDNLKYERQIMEKRLRQFIMKNVPISWRGGEASSTYQTLDSSPNISSINSTESNNAKSPPKGTAPHPLPDPSLSDSIASSLLSCSSDEEKYWMHYLTNEQLSRETDNKDSLETEILAASKLDNTDEIISQCQTRIMTLERELSRHKELMAQTSINPCDHFACEIKENRLKAQINKQTIEQNFLEEQCEELRRTNAELRAEMDRLNHETKALLAENETEKKACLNEKSAEVEELYGKVVSLSQDLEAARRCVAQEKEILRDFLVEIRNAIPCANPGGDASRCAAEIVQFVQERKGDCVQLSQRIKQLEEESRIQQEQYCSLQESLSLELKSKERELHRVSLERDRLEEMITARASEVAALKEERTLYESSLEAMQKELESVKTTINDFKEVHAGKSLNSLITELGQENSTLKTEIESLTDLIEAQMRDAEETLKEKLALNEEIEISKKTFEAEREERANAVKAIDAKNVDLLVDLANREAAIRDFESETESLKVQLEAAEERVGNAEEKCTVAEGRCAELTADLQGALSEKSLLMEEIEDERRKREELLARKCELESALSRQEKISINLNLIISHITEEKGQLAEELAESSRSLENLNEKLSQQEQLVANCEAMQKTIKRNDDIIKELHNETNSLSEMVCKLQSENNDLLQGQIASSEQMSEMLKTIELLSLNEKMGRLQIATFEQKGVQTVPLECESCLELQSAYAESSKAHSLLIDRIKIYEEEISKFKCNVAHVCNINNGEDHCRQPMECIRCADLEYLFSESKIECVRLIEKLKHYELDTISTKSDQTLTFTPEFYNRRLLSSTAPKSDSRAYLQNRRSPSACFDDDNHFYSAIRKFKSLPNLLMDFADSPRGSRLNSRCDSSPSKESQSKCDCQQFLQQKPRSRRSCLIFVSLISLLLLAIAVLSFHVLENRSKAYGSVRHISWRWLTWEELFGIFIKRDYSLGPPPV